MKKRLVIAKTMIIVIVLALTPDFVNASTKAIIEAGLSGFKIIWNGKQFESENPIVVIDGRTYIPLREFANQAGLIVDWNGDEEIINIDTFEFNESYEGVLSNGVAYEFYGKDKHNLSLEKIIIEKNLKLIRRFDDQAQQARTPEEAAQIAMRNYFNQSNISPNGLTIIIFYDYLTDCWVVEFQTIPATWMEEIIDGKPVLTLNGFTGIREGDSIITINRISGSIANYYGPHVLD